MGNQTNDPTAISTTVIYPNSSEAKLDINYYMKTHLPKAELIWGKLGMISWKVTSFTPDLIGNPPNYLLETVVEWVNVEAARKALQTDEGAEVMKDMENFTNISPIVLFGKPTGAWSA
ncbi:hypothetical protein N7452_010671 [Penicillium brevicompactum]|uniref:EthD domain-containing protein n=1 Tax=Penicillium brevicompactum TaxID=5074 RepID=A0A9W9U6U0_PENBR|nr:hypothetical protein N7452_010671 [Penicillium brevicompactum]